MFCPECGAANSEGSKFCCNCAKPLVETAYNKANKKDTQKKLHSAHLLNIISAVVLVLSFILIQYGVSTSTGSVNSSSNTYVNGKPTSSSSSSTTVNFDTSGADNAYTAICVGAVVVIAGLAVYFIRNEKQRKMLAYVYLVGALVAVCLQFFAGIKTISFTCGLGFVMTVSGILQIVAGSKFVSALKDA